MHANSCMISVSKLSGLIAARLCLFVAESALKCKVVTKLLSVDLINVV